MPQLTLIETADHSEVVYHLCQLLAANNIFEVTVLCKPYIAKQAPEYLKNAPSIKWCPFRENQSPRKAVSQKLDLLNNTQLIFWTTLPTTCGWINRLGLQVPMVAIIHNRYTWFAPYQHLSVQAIVTPVGILRFLRLLLWQRRQQKELIQRLAAVAFLSEAVLKHALAEKHAPPSGLAFAIPLPLPALQKKQLMKKGKQVVRAVIPGSITSNGRDYNVVSQAVAQALPLLDKKLHLVCLGKRSKVKGMKALERMTGPKFQLTTFVNWVPNDIYEHQLLEASFLILPIKQYRVFGLTKELIGRSAISGGVNDAIKYTLPMLIAAEYTLDNSYPLRNTYFYANTKELANLIVEAINNTTPIEVEEAENISRNAMNTLQKDLLNVLTSSLRDTTD